MGDQANVYIKGNRDADPGVYLYTHWNGTDLPSVVRDALALKERWDDPQYLARIVFCEMIGDDVGITGYGISAVIGDGAERIITLDPNTQRVTLTAYGRSISSSFSEYILDKPQWPSEPVADPNAPLTADQRNALFAAFGEVFAETSDAARYAFTRMVLGELPEAPVSWSSTKPGALTYAEASKVLDALDALNV